MNASRWDFDTLDPIDELTEADLIRLYQNQPDLEYIFKHAMTQEVAYKSLLKEERRDIHEKIGETIEQLFENRLFEFYEVLSFHFKHGLFEIKALDYLIKSGEKSLKRYSLVESDNYCREAYSILNAKTNHPKESYLLVNLIMKWALVYYYKGNAKGLNELIQSHETTVKSLNEKSMLGMYYAWLGFSYYNREKLSLAENFLTKALKIGEANYEER